MCCQHQEVASGTKESIPSIEGQLCPVCLGHVELDLDRLISDDAMSFPREIGFEE
jgi:hypothetical protein